MFLFDARTFRILVTILVFGLALLFIGLAWRTLVTFLFSILFAYLLEPVVAGLQYRLRLSRGRAVAALYLALLVALGLFAFLVGPHIVQQATHLAEAAPSLSAGLSSGQFVHEVGRQRGWSAETQLRLQQFLVAHRQQIAAWVQTRVQILLQEIANLASNAAWVALIPILGIFFLLAGGRFSDALVGQLARRRQRLFVAELFGDVHAVLASYIRAQIALTGLALAVYLAGFELMRLPYAIALGVAAGMLEFIPVIGPLLGALLVLVTALAINYPHLWVLVIFLGVWRVEQDYVNSPRIMGNQVQLHPLAVLFGVFAGAEIAGIIGVYLSIPIMATLRVVWVRWRSYPSTLAEGTAEGAAGGGEAPEPPLSE